MNYDFIKEMSKLQLITTNYHINTNNFHIRNKSSRYKIYQHFLSSLVKKKSQEFESWLHKSTFSACACCTSEITEFTYSFASNSIRSLTPCLIVAFDAQLVHTSLHFLKSFRQ